MLSFVDDHTWLWVIVQSAVWLHSIAELKGAIGHLPPGFLAGTGHFFYSMVPEFFIPVGQNNGTQVLVYFSLPMHPGPGEWPKEIPVDLIIASASKIMFLLCSTCNIQDISVFVMAYTYMTIENCRSVMS